MYWKVDIDSDLSGKKPSKPSLVLKISPELKAKFAALVREMKLRRNNAAFEALITDELGRMGKSLKDREFAKTRRR